MVSLKKATFRIGHLSEQFGVCPETIRVWERQGLIPAATRTAGGHRRYGFEHLDAMRDLIAPAAAQPLSIGDRFSSRF